MTSATTFDVFKDNSYIGGFTTGMLIVQPEIQFTVTGTYSVNDQWSFYTYPSYGTVVLNEPSIPVSVGTDIIINAIGGL
jgi:pantothenate kinase type III